MSDDEVVTGRQRRTQLSREGRKTRMRTLADSSEDEDLFQESSEDEKDDLLADDPPVTSKPDEFSQPKLKMAMSRLKGYLDPAPLFTAASMESWDDVLEEMEKHRIKLQNVDRLIDDVSTMSFISMPLEFKCMVATAARISCQVHKRDSNTKKAQELFRSRDKGDKTKHVANYVSNKWLQTSWKAVQSNTLTLGETVLDDKNLHVVIIKAAFQFMASAFVIDNEKKINVLKEKQEIDWEGMTNDVFRYSMKQRWNSINHAASLAKKHFQSLKGDSATEPAPGKEAAGDNDATTSGSSSAVRSTSLKDIANKKREARMAKLKRQAQATSLVRTSSTGAAPPANSRGAATWGETAAPAATATKAWGSNDLSSAGATAPSTGPQQTANAQRWSSEPPKAAPSATSRSWGGPSAAAPPPAAENQNGWGGSSSTAPRSWGKSATSDQTSRGSGSSATTAPSRSWSAASTPASNPPPAAPPSQSTQSSGWGSQPPNKSGPPATSWSQPSQSSGDSSNLGAPTPQQPKSDPYPGADSGNAGTTYSSNKDVAGEAGSRGSNQGWGSSNLPSRSAPSSIPPRDGPTDGGGYGGAGRNSAQKRHGEGDWNGRQKRPRNFGPSNENAGRSNVAPSNDAGMGRGRGRGRTLPAWMTQQGDGPQSAAEPSAPAHPPAGSLDAPSGGGPQFGGQDNSGPAPRANNAPPGGYGGGAPPRDGNAPPGGYGGGPPARDGNAPPGGYGGGPPPRDGNAPSGGYGGGPPPRDGNAPPGGYGGGPPPRDSKAPPGGFGGGPPPRDSKAPPGGFGGGPPPRDQNLPPSGRGRGRTLPAWMTSGQNGDGPQAKPEPVPAPPAHVGGAFADPGAGRGRGRGRTLPAWMTQNEGQGPEPPR